MSIVSILGTVLLIFGCALIARFTSIFVRIPVPLLVMLTGAVASFLIPFLEIDTGIRHTNFSELVFNLLIPLLIFEAVINLDIRVLKPIAGSIVASATVGLAMATGVSALLLYYWMDHPEGFPWIAALLAGVLISTTDPSIIVQQLKRSGAPHGLSAFIEGESLFSDVGALVLFIVFLSFALAQQQVSLIQSLGLFAYTAILGAVVGLIAGIAGRWIMKVFSTSFEWQVLATVFLVYGSYLLAEQVLNVSGVVSVVCLTFVIKSALTQHKKRKKAHSAVWNMLAFFASIIVFFLIGLVFSSDMFSERWLAIIFAVVAGFIARSLGLLSTFIIGKYVLREPLPWRYWPLTHWGGVRGVVTVALVLSLPVELDYWWTIQSMGVGVVLFSLISQATTHQWLTRRILSQKR